MAGSRPTQADVARLAGVSRQTVSLVVLDDPRVSDRSRAVVRRAMQQLGYRPNVAARALAAHRTGFVGIVLSDLGNPFHADIVEALRRRFEDDGLIPFIAPVGDDPREEAVAVGRFLQMNVDGLVLISPLATDAELAVIGRQVPTVLVTRNLGPTSVDLVHTDDRAGAHRLTRHLLDRGYDPVVYVGYDRGVPGDSSSARMMGYRAAMVEHGRMPLIVPVGADGVAAAVGPVLREHGPGLALCCHNDLTALEVLGVLAAYGLAPGRDAGVAGFDNTTIAGYPGVSLTSIDQGTEEMARRAVGLIGERLAGRDEAVDIVVPLSLVVRQSSTRE